MANSSAAWRHCWICVALLLILMPSTVGAGEKNDLVVLAKGARLVVEIKSMDLGQLQASTDEMGTVYIEWDDIAAVSSQTIFDVTVESGEKFVGALGEGPGAGTLVLAQQNTGLGLDRRLMGGAMFGRVLAVSNRNLFFVFAGANYSDEQYTGQRALSEEGFDSSYQSEDQTVEGMLLLAYQGFRYDSPKYSLDVRLMVLPGITDSDRLRLQFQGSVSYEIFHDFTTGISVGYAYDSMPPVTGVENYTYILGATIGYSFN